MKNSEKNGTGKKKIRDIPKDQVNYSNSEVFTVNEDLEIDGTFVVGYKDLEFIDLRDAAENLALSQHKLVRELLKLEIKIWVGFDEISSRMVKIVPPIDHQKFIDYRINPGDIHCLTLDSSKRIERMLEKSELVFEGLRQRIDFCGYPLTIQILQEDPGMHLVIMEENLDMLKSLLSIIQIYLVLRNLKKLLRRIFYPK